MRIERRFPQRLLRIGLLLSLRGLSSNEAGIAAGDQVIEVLEDFESAGNARDLGPLTFWRWSDEQKQNAASFSGREVAAIPGGEGKALRVSIHQALPPLTESYPLWSTGRDYLPPEATAVRMRVKVVSGRFTLTVGSPTTYFATSDVQALPQVLEPADDWQTVTFSLIHSLERNYRRPVFSSESPVIYYTRWIQEPMRISMSADSQGEIWIDDVTLVASGEGRPFPRFDDSAVRPLTQANLPKAFTIATDDREYDLSHTANQEPRRKPAIIRALPNGSLEASLRGEEEVSFLGLPIDCPEGTNAFRLTLKMDHAGNFDELVVDLLALVSANGTFPWDKTAVADSPQPDGFDYCLSPRRTEGVSWGFYHARRALRNGEPTTLIVPFADFVCGYGTGDLKERHQQQEPLNANEVVALALAPPFRQRSADTVFTLEKIEAVTIPGADLGALISYPQVTDPTKIRLEKIPGPYGQRARQVEAPSRP